LGKKIVDKPIVQMWGKHLEQCSRTCLWQLFHATKATQKNQLRQLQVGIPFLKPNYLIDKCLQLFRKHPLKGRNYYSTPTRHSMSGEFPPSLRDVRLHSTCNDFCPAPGRSCLVISSFSS
jgi:hypothetical protein